MAALNVDRTLSAWEVDSGQIFLASLRDAEAVAKKYFNNSDPLIDPPRASEPVSSQEESFVSCLKTGPSMNTEHRTRPAPSVVNRNQDANTVEIVKHMGKYEVVIDGVSQGIIEKKDGAYRDAYTFWMPRFKEKTVQHKIGDEVKVKRVVQPVLFAMRIEDFESVPSKCVVESMQRVVHDGELYMDDTKIKTSEITPYQVNSDSAKVTILPYPLICTPAPYVTINDYSKAMNKEMALKFHFSEDNVMKDISTIWNIITGKEKLTTQKKIEEILSVTQKFFGSSLNRLGLATASASALAGLASASASALTGGVLEVASNPETLLPMATYLFWKYITKRKGEFRLTQGKLESTQIMLATALAQGPKIHTITLPRLTQMIYRIADTRANGSMALSTDNTIGWSIHDFKKMNWNEEASLLKWIIYGSGIREGEDKYTGIYDDSSNVSHVGKFQIGVLARNAPLTFNTIGVQGMHPLTLANSRTEFSYTIRIQENDGTPGPVIVLDATRINGLDAGWIAAGYEEQFAECRRAADCLRSRMARLPSLSRYMSGNRSIVGDAFKDVFTPDNLDDETKLVLGRQNAGAVLSKTELQKRLSKLKEHMNTAKRRECRRLNYIGKLENKVQSLKADLFRKQEGEFTNPREVARAKEQLKREESRANPNTARIQAAKERLRILNRRTNKDEILEVKKRLRKIEDDLHTAQQEQSMYDVEVEYFQNKIEHSKSVKKIAHIFDYEASYRRILKYILGDKPFEYKPEDYPEQDSDKDLCTEEADEDFDTYPKDDFESKQHRFWTNAFYDDKRDNESDGDESHLSITQEMLASSLGVESLDVDFLSYQHVRFIEMLSPPAGRSSDQNLMRFSAFLVPKPIEYYDYTRPKYIVRLMPQVLILPTELVSAFASSTILQPTSLTDKTLISQEDESVVSKSIAQARIALANISSALPQLIKEMSVYGSSNTHFYQNYEIVVRDAWEVSKILHLELKEEALGLDFFATSYFPCLEGMRNISEATEAGGSLLANMKNLASGKDLQGVARTLDVWGLSRNFYSYLALASFAEIVTHHIVEHGHSTRKKAGFGLERIELVQSGLSTAKYSARAIGNFLLNIYGSKTNASGLLHERDILFYCIPGLSHLWVALRRLRLFSERTEGTYEFACVSMGRSLLKLASADSAAIQKLPFTCAQSALGNLPLPVRMLSGNASSVEVHIRSGSLSYERICLMASMCSHKGNASAIACICADVIFTRPILIKAFSESPVVSSAVASQVSNSIVQEGWSKPPTLVSITQILQSRLARLRLDIFPEQKHGLAANKASVNGGSDVVESLLTMEMNRLDFRDLSTRVQKRKVANYFVPFGFIDKGTLGDMFHSEFEQHPVWLQLLMDAANSLIVVDDSNVANTRVVSSERNEFEQPHNPHIIKITDSYTRLQLYPTKSAESVLPNQAADTFKSSAASMAQMCIDINESGLGHLVSGKLCEHYRLCMHNSERLFQAVIALASNIHNPDRSNSVRIALEIQNHKMFHMPVFAASVCIANALADALVGSKSRIVMRDTGRGERDACQKIEFACKQMLRNGIKAVPFGEMCISLSLL